MELVALRAGEPDGKQRGDCTPWTKWGRGKSVEPLQPWQVKTPGQIAGIRALVRGDDDGRAAREAKKEE